MYVTDTLIKLTAGSKLEEDKLWGIKGFEVKVEICKSRHAPAGRAMNMIYDQVNGFRDDLSKVDYIKSNNALKGNGMAYYLDGCETKFKLSNVVEKMKADPTLKAAIDNVAEGLLLSSIKESKNLVYTEEKKETPEEYVDNQIE